MTQQNRNVFEGINWAARDTKIRQVKEMVSMSGSLRAAILN
jgi:hypothetical protein